MACKEVLTAQEAAQLPHPSAASFGEILHRSNTFLKVDHAFREAGYAIHARPTMNPLDAMWVKDRVTFTHGEVMRRIAAKVCEKAGQQAKQQKAGGVESVRRKS